MAKKQEDNDLSLVMNFRNLSKVQAPKETNKYLIKYKEMVPMGSDIKTICKAISELNKMVVGFDLDTAAMEDKNELLEAFEYVFDHAMWSVKNQNKIFKHFKGEWPTFIQLGTKQETIKNSETIAFAFDALPQKKKDLAKNILKKIWNTSENRRVEVDVSGLYLEKSIPEELMEEMYSCLKYMILDFLEAEEEQLAFVFTIEKETEKIIQALVNVGGEIHSMSKEELYYCFTHHPITGEPTKPPKNTRFEDWELE